MPAVIYARKSTDRDDRQAQSLEDQVTVLRDLASREGIRVMEVISEAKSAKNPGERPEFQRMMELVRTGRVDGILAWSMDRLSRNLVDGGAVAHALQAGQLRYIRTPARSYQPEDNVLILSVENGMSAGYLQDLSRNVKRGMGSKAERGWRPGSVPAGYLNNPLTREIDPDPKTFPIVRKGWELFLTGSYTPIEVARKLEAMGLRRRDGKRLGHTTIYGMLRNPFYAGRLVHAGAEHRAKHQPMISLADFDHAQEILKGGRPRRCLNRRDHQFAGVLRCAECGFSVVGESKSRLSKRTGQVRTYTYYHCSGWKGCPRRGVPEEAIRSAIMRAANDAKLDPEFTEAGIRILLESANRGEGVQAEVYGSLQAEIDRTTARLKRAKELLLDGHLGAEDYAETKLEYEGELSVILQEKQSAERQAAQIDRIIEQCMRAGLASLQVDEMDAEGLRACAVSIASERTVGSGKVMLRLDPLITEIASFERRVLSSQSYERGDQHMQDSFWWSELPELRKIAKAHLDSENQARM